MERIDINVLYLLGLLRCVFRGTAAGSARAISTMIQNHLIISDYEPGNTPGDALLKKAERSEAKGLEFKKKKKGLLFLGSSLFFSRDVFS